jgi:S-adenosylmethionine hydrolase
MIVTLLSDFGTGDYFVGAMKGALLAVNPEAQIVDVTHDIPPHDIDAAAFLLLAVFDTFPKGTVHVAVVDPGVGSTRRAIVATGSGYHFVGPDNGVFGHVYERLTRLRVIHATNPAYFRETVSSTFHGRDIFAPIAGALSRGEDAKEMGAQIEDFARLELATPRKNEDGSLTGAIIHVDHFGNCITNFTPAHLPETACNQGFLLVAGDVEVRSFRRFFADEGGLAGKPFAFWGGAGFLEIAVYRDSASRRLGLKRGQSVVVALPTAKG